MAQYLSSSEGLAKRVHQLRQADVPLPPLHHGGHCYHHTPVDRGEVGYRLPVPAQLPPDDVQLGLQLSRPLLRPRPLLLLRLLARPQLGQLGYRAVTQGGQSAD